MNCQNRRKKWTALLTKVTQFQEARQIGFGGDGERPSFDGSKGTFKRGLPQSFIEQMMMIGLEFFERAVNKNIGPGFRHD